VNLSPVTVLASFGVCGVSAVDVCGRSLPLSVDGEKA
jgi:hypothetical protein